MPAGTPSPAPSTKPTPTSHAGRNIGIVALVVVLAAVGFGVAAHRKQGGASPASASSASASVSPVSIMPATPIALKAAATTTEIKLSWKPALGGNEPVAYAITRDGSLVRTVQAPTTTWSDLHLIPGRLYLYTVSAVDGGGAHSVAATVGVKTKVPPLSVTPILGQYSAALSETSHFGFASFAGYHASLGWRIKPSCASVVCGIDVRDLRDPSNFHATLAKHGATYTGSLRTKGFGTCNGTTTYAEVTITLHPTQAKEAGNKWRVTKLAGTLVARTAAQLGCVASGIDYALTVTYYG
jgi:hypothetical protein